MTELEAIVNRLADFVKRSNEYPDEAIELLSIAKRMREIEIRNIESSWEGQVDRQGGSFTDQEILDSLQNNY